MPELVFHTGPMDCGKSTLALQFDHTQSTHGRQGRIFTSQDRSGAARVSSRLGLEAPATDLVCDEAQFYTGEQVEQLARIVDELQIDVYTFGILADFRTRLFPGSQRLVELADRVETLPMGPLCWCGEKGTHNARTIDGLMVTEGSQVVVGDTGSGEICYEVLCRAHHRRGMTATRARATLGEDPLPFGD